MRRAALVLGLPAVLVGVWWVAGAGSTNLFAPPLQEILRSGFETWTWPRLRADVLPSLGRLAGGYLLACLVGIAAGVAVGLSRRTSLAAAPVLEFLRAVPPPVLVPVLMLVIGIGDSMRITVIALGCVWPVLLNTVDGVRSVDAVLTDTARSMRLTGAARLRHLVLPAASPRISAGMYQALGLGIILMVVSEMFAAESGIGASVVRFQQSFAMPQMWSGVLLLGGIGVALSILYRTVESRVLAWHAAVHAPARSR